MRRRGEATPAPPVPNCWCPTLVSLCVHSERTLMATRARDMLARKSSLSGDARTSVAKPTLCGRTRCRQARRVPLWRAARRLPRAAARGRARLPQHPPRRIPAREQSPRRQRAPDGRSGAVALVEFVRHSDRSRGARGTRSAAVAAAPAGGVPGRHARTFCSPIRPRATERRLCAAACAVCRSGGARCLRGCDLRDCGQLVRRASHLPIAPRARYDTAPERLPR